LPDFFAMEECASLLQLMPENRRKTRTLE